jgi:hypothetical protein
MSEESFDKLVNLIRHDVTVDYTKSRQSTVGNDPIYPELIVATGLRFLGGEQYKSLADIFGVSLSSAERITKMFLSAILGCEELALKLPKTLEDLTRLANGFHNLSGADGLFYGVIGAIDGWLCCINQPKVDNARDYFSGHYHTFGLNVQAMCDYKLRFQYIAVAGPGKKNDIQAIRRCIQFLNWVRDTLEIDPPNYYIIGDNAYELKDSLLIPFSGSNLAANESAYNYFLSQLRIRIEMAFGRMTTMWRIFRSNLEHDLEMCSDIINVVARLHNYVIDEDSPDEDDDDFIEPMLHAPRGLGYLPWDPSAIHANVVQPGGVSARRQVLLHLVTTRGLQRPSLNLERNSHLFV